jgi:hypothetical protein
MMKIHIDWQKPIPLRRLSAKDVERVLSMLEKEPGIYIFGRMWGSTFSPLYVGQAERIYGRVKTQLNNRALIEHVLNAKIGRRCLVVVYLVRNSHHGIKDPLDISEKALIRHFVAEGYDLHNKLGTKTPKHEVVSEGVRPKKAIPISLWVEKK